MTDTSTHCDGTKLTLSLLDSITDAFNQMKLDAVMAHFAADATFDHGAGPEIYGRRFKGSTELRAVFQKLFDAVESVHWETLDARIAGNKAFCEYRRIAKYKDGQTQDFLSVDILTFRDGLIVHKDTFFKNRSA